MHVEWAYPSLIQSMTYFDFFIGEQAIQYDPIFD